MAFPDKLKCEVENYINKHHPNQAWWEQYFDIAFVSDVELAKRLVQEMMSIRTVYQLLEGLRAQNELLRAQSKIQIITYASVYEAILHHIIFKTDLKLNQEVINLLSKEKYVKRSLPMPHQNITHNGEIIYTMAKVPITREERYIKFEEILHVTQKLNLIDSSLYEDLLELYNLRNAIHIHAEIAKGINYQLEISKKAHKLIKPFKNQIIDGLKAHKLVDRKYNVKFSRKELIPKFDIQ
ncbi:MAG: hypothetical protein P4L28_02265 [Paludibacteraceae bacterium]|nr:hypothetical protein [Paludibacteraceae bacterium]